MRRVGWDHLRRTTKGLRAIFKRPCFPHHFFCHFEDFFVVFMVISRWPCQSLLNGAGGGSDFYSSIGAFPCTVVPVADCPRGAPWTVEFPVGVRQFCRVAIGGSYAGSFLDLGACQGGDGIESSYEYTAEFW